MRRVVVAVFGVGLATVVGCGSRSVGYLQDAEDAGAGGQSGAATTFGIVSLVHSPRWGSNDQESLTLSGAFFVEEYDPELQPWSYVETLQTPDGASCDIYRVEGLGTGFTPPEPPAQVNGGRLTAGAGSNVAEQLEIVFAGDQYATDWRTPTSANKPWPSWASSGTVAVTFEGQGSILVGAFAEAITLPDMPSILTPPHVQFGPGLNYLIDWQLSEVYETLVVLQFYTDFHEHTFRCHPPPGITELLLPATWIGEWTYGFGQLQLIWRNEVTSTAGSAEVSLRVDLVHRQAVWLNLP